MRNTIRTQVDANNLLRHRRENGAHMRPIWSALGAGCGLLQVRRNGLPFDLPPVGMGSIVIVEDDAGTTEHGPAGFDAASVEWLVRCVDLQVVLSYGPLPEAYADAAAEAMRGGSALIVETVPEAEADWLLAIVTAAPGRLVGIDFRGPYGRATR